MNRYTRAQIDYISKNAANMTVEEIQKYLGTKKINAAYHFCQYYRIPLKGRKKKNVDTQKNEARPNAKRPRHAGKALLR